MTLIVAAFGNWRVVKDPDEPGFKLVYCHFQDGFVLSEEVLDTFPAGHDGQMQAVAALKRRGFD